MPNAHAVLPNVNIPQLYKLTAMSWLVVSYTATASRAKNCKTT